MSLFFPHRYKRIGAVLSLSGFALLMLMQPGFTMMILPGLTGGNEGYLTLSVYHSDSIVAIIVSFSIFLFGLYLITFSREKNENERVQGIRRDSVLFATLLLILLAVAGFSFLLIVGEPVENSAALFFVGILFLSWIAFIVRFNLVLYARLKRIKNDPGEEQPDDSFRS